MFNSSSKACWQLVLRGATENALLTHWMTFQRVGSGFHSGPECSTSPGNLLSTHQVVILLLGKDPRLPKESLFHIHYLTTVNHLQLLSVELLSYSFIFHCAFKQSTCSRACSEKWQDSSFSTFAGNWSFTARAGRQWLPTARRSQDCASKHTPPGVINYSAGLTTSVQTVTKGTHDDQCTISQNTRSWVKPLDHEFCLFAGVNCPTLIACPGQCVREEHSVKQKITRKEVFLVGSTTEAGNGENG